MKINIICPGSGWILDKIAERIVQTNKELNTGVEMEIFIPPQKPDIDINYYVDLYNCYRQKSVAKDIGFFTCLDKNSLDSFQPYWRSLDFVTHMNKEQLEKWIEAGYPREKMKVIPMALNLEQFPLKKIVLGVFQRGGYPGKGHQFMLKLPEIMDLSNFEFLFVGKDWDEVFFKYAKSGIEVTHCSDDDYENYPNHYEKIDYLLIPSLWEGGPMALLEALARGIPVIASRVGFVPEFAVEHTFEPGNHLELAEILMKLEKERLDRRKKVEQLTWENHVKELIKVFECVCSI